LARKYFIVAAKYNIISIPKMINYIIDLKSGSGATRPLPRNLGAEELHGDPIFRPRYKVWTRAQKWKK